LGGVAGGLGGRVRVRAPARLHLGFLDLAGSLGRRFGSLGLSLDEPALALTLARAPRAQAEGPDAPRLLKALRAAAAHLGVPDACAVAASETIPSHAGFGSGTQIALAVAAGLARLHGLTFDAPAAAAALDRGNRSGIGLAAFQGGGLILDGGREPGGPTPPVIARLDLPEAWRAVLVLDAEAQGIHGAQETEAFRALPPFPDADAAHLCRLALMQILPAAAEGRLEPFARGIAELQRRVGDVFAPVQGGRFTSPLVADALGFCEGNGVPGVGQSSWGPTGFALVGSQAQAESVMAALRRRPGVPARITYAIARMRNRGADVDAEPSALRRLGGA
jgi:beta-RFAP synthase